MYESPAPAPPPPETNGVVGSQSQIHERECPMFISPAPGTRPPAGEGECTASSKNWKAEMEKARLKGPFTPRKQLNVTGALSKGDGRRKVRHASFVCVMVRGVAGLGWRARKLTLSRRIYWRKPEKIPSVPIISQYCGDGVGG